MAIVAVTGECCTTTAVALAAAWSVAEDVVVIEADPSGGDLAAWFDVPVSPSLSTVVTVGLDGRQAVDRHTRLAPCGLRVLPAPVGTAEARQAIALSGPLASTLSGAGSLSAIVDAGAPPAQMSTNPFLAVADVTVLVHRQTPHSGRAAGVRLQRFADLAAPIVGGPGETMIAIVGQHPFDIAQVERFLVDSVGEVVVVGLPEDPLSAAVYAGRTGVSARRLARLPLARAARDLAAAVAGRLVDATPADAGARA